MLDKGFTVPDLALPPLPQPVSWLPLPDGWYWLAACLALGAGVWGLLRVARWRRNRWRREASALARNLDNADEWLVVVRRILLVHHPRAEVSRLQGVEAVLAQVPLDADLVTVLAEKYCQPDNRLPEPVNARIRGQIAQWLEEIPDV